MKSIVIGTLINILTLYGFYNDDLNGLSIFIVSLNTLLVIILNFLCVVFLRSNEVEWSKWPKKSTFIFNPFFRIYSFSVSVLFSYLAYKTGYEVLSIVYFIASISLQLVFSKLLKELKLAGIWN